jgi:molybdenum cofactor biosynthesis enzyme MoaA
MSILTKSSAQMFVLACTTDSVTVRRDLSAQLASGVVTPSRCNDCNRIRTTPGRGGVLHCLLLVQGSTNKSDTRADEYGKVSRHTRLHNPLKHRGRCADAFEK